jgi:hypothetical protein
VRKKRKRPRKVVCRHKKGMCKRRKGEDQGRWSVSTRRGREKEEKKKAKEGKKVVDPQRQGSVCPQPRISFFGSRVFGFGSGPSCLKYQLLRDLVNEEAMCEGSSGNRLPYAAKAVP